VKTEELPPVDVKEYATTGKVGIGYFPNIVLNSQ
jgi:hypothetical protein